MSENKKLTQLTEKLTSLDPNDLLYVSANGISKSIKASTLEAPLKTYADTKASEAQAAAISAANSSAQSAVNAEAVRATAAESGLQGQITTEISNRISADSSLQSNINIESSRAVSAESSLQTQISQEVSDRQALASRVSSLEVDPVTKSYVDSEVSDMQLQISAILSNVDPVALDSFTEVVSAFQAADNSLSGAITTLTNNLTNSLNAEITSRQSAISSEQSSRIAADSSLQSQITQEVSDRQAAITQEVSDRNAAIYTATTGHIIPRETLVYDLGSADYRFRDLYLSGDTIILGETIISSNDNGEINLQEGATIGGLLIASENYVDGSISNEQSERIFAVNSLQSAIDAEESRALSAESDLLSGINSLQGYVDQEISSTIAGFNTQIETLASEISEDYVSWNDYYFRQGEFLSDIEASIAASVAVEASARTSADATTLQSAKDYIDTEISDLTSEMIARDNTIIISYDNAIANAITTESVSRQQEVQAARQYCTSYADDEVDAERTLRVAADAATLQSAKNYTDAVVAGISSGSGSASLPSGVIHTFAGTTAPAGYLLCDGSAVSRSTYSDLFAVIGTSFGSGDGSTTFNLPNPDTNANLRLIIKI